jgi:GntR family transcriptional regulator, rspAB operon transcriptional repressor
MAMRSRDEGKTQPVPVFSGRHDRRKVTDWVYEELKSAIVDLRLAPGDPLREATLAEQLGVSKTPIREALTRLEQEGLVETTSFKGAMVTGYSRQDLIEIYELRELLENAAARAAAESMSDADRDRLRRICRESRKLKKGHDAAGLAALISEFDDVLFDEVGNSRIRALIENLRAHLTRIGQLTAEIPGRIEASVDEHERILEAIAARDPELAERQMSRHIRSVRDDQLRALGEASAQP